MPDHPPWDGRPRDPETSGWHWLETRHLVDQLYGEPKVQRSILYWSGRRRLWIHNVGLSDPADMAEIWRYLGPVNPVPLGMENADG